MGYRLVAFGEVSSLGWARRANLHLLLLPVDEAPLGTERLNDGTSLGCPRHELPIARVSMGAPNFRENPVQLHAGRLEYGLPSIENEVSLGGMVGP